MLSPGDTIGIVAPSKSVAQDQIILLDNFEKALERWNINVVRGEHIFKTDTYGVSASPKDRAEDMNAMIKDPRIKAIWCFQGGDTANAILDLIDYDHFKAHPKLVIGKSDIDVLHLAIYHMTGVQTIHGCDAKIGQGREFDYSYTQEWFEKRLMQESKQIIPAYPWKTIREGSAEGTLLGCNVTSILKLVGTPYLPDFSNAILFLESFRINVGKALFQLTQLKQAGILTKAKGVVIGHMQEFDGCYEDMVRDITSDIPILKIEEFGHYYPNAFLPIGAKIHLDATNKVLKLL